ncbi:MAG: hypothetical protein M9883_06770 [Methylobacteriaceae bacterium]|nr:hypothetical protein [Methylobacteriaceae bacterium]
MLYLDELTVCYLDFVDLLEPLTTAVANVFVHQDVERDVRATLQHASDAEGMLTGIEQIREIVDAAVTRGRVVFCRRHRDDDGVDADERADMGPSPTLDILSDLHGVDAAVALTTDALTRRTTGLISTAMLPCPLRPWTS